jgi:hypothetical protein
MGVSMHDLIHIIYSYDKTDLFALEHFSLIAGNRISKLADGGQFDRIENVLGQCTAKMDVDGTTYIRVALTPEDYAVMDTIGDAIGPIKREDYPGYAIVDGVQVTNRSVFMIQHNGGDIRFGGWG